MSFLPTLHTELLSLPAQCLSCYSWCPLENIWNQWIFCILIQSATLEFHLNFSHFSQADSEISHSTLCFWVHRAILFCFVGVVAPFFQQQTGSNLLKMLVWHFLGAFFHWLFFGGSSSLSLSSPPLFVFFFYIYNFFSFFVLIKPLAAVLDFIIILFSALHLSFPPPVSLKSSKRRGFPSCASLSTASIILLLKNDHWSPEAISLHFRINTPY